ncbi:hypothetical protein RUND412_000525 [Rhizina undulata]
MESLAILKSRDIVTLIRDTDAHERALFTVPEAQQKQKSVASRRNTAVYSVLGGDMIENLRRGGGVVHGGGGEVDVEVLLDGAERLLSVYHMPGAQERIISARKRFDHLTESLTNYEALVEAQREQLEIMHNPEWVEEEEQEEEDLAELIRKEEAEIEGLEKRKQELEERIRGADRAMGGF